MKQVYSAQDLVEAQFLKDFMIANNIEVIIKGEMLMGAIGEIPANTTPSVWGIDDASFDKAKELVTVFEGRDRALSTDASVWKCLDCDELIEPQFSQCWSCGKPR